MNVFELEGNGEYSHVVWMKGAPERIWAKCGYLHKDGKAIKIDDGIQKNFDDANEHFARNGERVLGFARILLKKNEFPVGYKFDLKNPLKLPFADGDF